MNSDIQFFLKKTITDNAIVLFMKGTAQFPQCGFSGKAIALLKQCGAKDIVTFNVLTNDEVRQGIKQFSNWPTIPQLYIQGEFIGGSDIMSELFEQGKLQTLITQANLTQSNQS